MICISLTKGQHAIVDEDDFHLVSKYKWHAGLSSDGLRYYAGTNIRTEEGKMKRIKLHRLIMGIDDKMIEVDHVDGNTLNNVRSNLRICNHAENQRNKKEQSNNTSGYKGVSLKKQTGKWQAVICINSKQIHLGYFPTPEDAHAAYCKAANKYHGDYANFGNMYHSQPSASFGQHREMTLNR